MGVAGMPVAPPASAVPHYLQKSASNAPRPRSPSLQQHSGTPPPGSPIKRSTTPGAISHPHFSVPNAPLPHLPPKPEASRAQVDVDLVLLERPVHAVAHLEEPFTLSFQVSASAALPSNIPDLLQQELPRKRRIISLAVQHILPDPGPSSSQSGASTKPVPPPSIRRRGSQVFSPGIPLSSSGMHSPSSNTGSIDMLTPRRVVSPPPGDAVTGGGHLPGTLAAEGSIASPTAISGRGVAIGGLTEKLRNIALSEVLGLAEDERATGAFGDDVEEFIETCEVKLPPPYKASTVDTAPKPDLQDNRREPVGRIEFLGPSAIFLPPIELQAVPCIEETQSEPRGEERGEGSAEFCLTFYPKARGFAKIGGLRVLLVKDEERADRNGADDVTLQPSGDIQPSEAGILKEWGVVAELWVR
jgi:trafficking protein particle complex subunit 13